MIKSTYIEKKSQSQFQKKSNLVGRAKFGTLEGIEFIDFNEIVYCEAKNNYTLIYKTDGVCVTFTKTLSAVEEELPKNQFLRIHHSYLVNILEMKSFYRNTNRLLLRNGKELQVSTRKKQVILSLEVA